MNQKISITKTVKMKLMMFEYYNNFYKHVLDEEDYEKNYRKDWWIFAEDCVSTYGIADKIVTDITEIM